MKVESDQPGLYCPSLESDACGTGFLAQLRGEASNALIQQALEMLENMEHRGAVGYEENTGDGAGILLQKPDQLLRRYCDDNAISLPAVDAYGLGVVFFPQDILLREKCRQMLNEALTECALTLITYRTVPVNREGVGQAALSVEPRMEQVLVRSTQGLQGQELEKALYVFRKYASHIVRNMLGGQRDAFYLACMSTRTTVYKGQLTTYQVKSYFPDLSDPDCRSAIALIHSRFSTNTTPKWKLAQPFRMIAHNGEINTITGNVNWWRARERELSDTLFTKEQLEKIRPVCGERLSDSGNFDNILEFLTLGGYSVAEALMLMIPEAWEADPSVSAERRHYYAFNRQLMEPWDGPAAVCFTDGRVVGASLDRNGLRPLRYCLREDGLLIAASEAGALPTDQSRVLEKGRLQPGRMLIADLSEGRIIRDEELKHRICTRHPYGEWLQRQQRQLTDLVSATDDTGDWSESVLLFWQQRFGVTREDLKFILQPMIERGKDPIGSMGADTPLAVLSQKSQHLSNYFKQLFAQVTNPPIDPIRERSVMSLSVDLGGSRFPLEQREEVASFLHLPQPILRGRDYQQLSNQDDAALDSVELSIHFKRRKPGQDLQRALDELCARAQEEVENGKRLICLSDRFDASDQIPIPALLAVAAVHHHLVRAGLRNRCSLVVETADARSTHHFATLLGFGAEAVYPYLAFQTITHLQRNGAFENLEATEDPIAIYIDAIGKGLLKVMSKIGVSTLHSYIGAQTFEAVGIHRRVVDAYFAGTISRIGGLTLSDIAREAYERHQRAFGMDEKERRILAVGGLYQWKVKGEAHLFNPKSIHHLQLAARTNDKEAYRKYADVINEQSKQAMTLRGLLELDTSQDTIPLEEVEPAEDIMRRFATGAMSFGSLSHEAHATLAVAMNRIGAKSNSGEGGEDPIRFTTKENGDSERSAIKQVASGRFGVTSYYLSNADEIQIKMAQGAKPGEGGQLPGHKVDDWIGRVRHSTPGVGLISPPPHHDIYSIEDLAQLIYDLKNANPSARINVKLVSKAGVGIIASGVAKAHAEAILISGHDGGTGASPLTSIRHAGLPWELGLAESHQTLLRNKLRERVVLQADGQMRTGRDLAIATLLGAEEWGVATAALVVEGCILMRKCHLNTCPVGIATQDPELRKRFTGKAEHVVNFFRFLAEDLRQIMASLGFRSVDEMVGRVDKLKPRRADLHWKYKNLDLSPILHEEAPGQRGKQHWCREQQHGLEQVLDQQLIRRAQPALQRQQQVHGSFLIKNTNRAVGTLLSHPITRKYGAEGLPAGTLRFRFRGSAGQSFGAFAVRGLHATLEGEANDYFGKGLSGARLITVPDRSASFAAHEQIIIGNVALLGATSGEAYICGRAGERFAVRNSGARTVVEGLGDHGCEYMTGGLVLVLGDIGKNFAAGMSGGVAFLFDPNSRSAERVNRGMVDLERPDEHDLHLIQCMVRNHFGYSSSKVARTILEDWDNLQGHFIKVMPRQYKQVLARQKRRFQLDIQPVEASA